MFNLVLPYAQEKVKILKIVLLIRFTHLKTVNNIKCRGRCEKTGFLIYIWYYVIGITSLNWNFQSLQKFKKQMPFDSVITLLGISPREVLKNMHRCVWNVIYIISNNEN